MNFWSHYSVLWCVLFCTHVFLLCVAAFDCIGGGGGNFVCLCVLAGEGVGTHAHTVPLGI